MIGAGMKLFRESLMSALIHCIYSSVANGHFDEEDLPELLRKSRIANARKQITGMLTYINGNFLHVIEREEGAVDALFKKNQTGSPAQTSIHARQGIHHGAKLY